MKAMFLTKRYFMSKDTILEKYGRYYHVATGLVDRGWTIRACCLDYRSAYGKRKTLEAGNIEWHVYPWSALGYRWRKDIEEMARAWCPDVVIASSDSIHIASGLRASLAAGAPLVLDLHDNLESFRLMKVPGRRSELFQAIHSAQLVFCVSDPLRKKVIRDYAPAGHVSVLENAIPSEFQGMGRDDGQERADLGLETDARIIGLAGALYKKRGLETILDGFETLRRVHHDLLLVLAGPTDKTRRRFGREGIRYMGNLEYRSIPSLLRTFDVGVIPNIRPEFAEYCHPQKAVEFCAIGVPVVAADIGVIRDFASNQPRILYQPDEPEDFARAVEYQLAHRELLYMPVKTWSEQSKTVHESLQSILR